jgi:Capsule polysaccharide biosynthesis protein
LNYIYVTQGGYIRSFYLIEKSIRKICPIESAGYYVSDKENFSKFLRQVSPKWEKNTNVVCEWDIIDEALSNHKVNDESVRENELRYGDPTFWNALVCDRRMIYGKHTVYTQDYSPRFNHEEMQSILFVAMDKIKNHIEIVKPDFILSFINVTFGEYLYYCVAKEMGIPFLNLRNTKIENYVTVAPDIFEPSKKIKSLFLNLQKQAVSKTTKKKAESYYFKLAKQRATYEGQNYINEVQKPFTFTPKGLLNTIAKPAYWLGKTLTKNREHTDNHSPSPFWAAIYKDTINPLRYRKVVKKYSRRFKSIDEIKNINYAFFPLHLEPEISLLTYSRPYFNQIEVIRWCAYSLPVGWKLVIKDHPKNPYYRKKDYFKKLFEIPNVIMVPPDSSTFELICWAKAIMIISGFVGFEAICQAKPVIAFGRTAFEFLPKTMQCRVDDPKKIAKALHDLLDNYKIDEEAIKKYITAVMYSSVRFDWYSIGKKLSLSNCNSLDEFAESEELVGQFDRITEYIFENVVNWGSNDI